MTKSKGRPKSLIQRCDVKLRLEVGLAEKLDNICFDVLRKRVEMGARSLHIERALTEYFTKYYPIKVAPPPPLTNGVDKLTSTTYDENR